MRILLFCIVAMTWLTPNESLARVWSYAEIADLERAAEGAPAEGLALSAAAITRLGLLEHLADLGVAPYTARDIAADMLFSQLAEDYARGAVDPAAVDPDWRLPRPAPPDHAALRSALDAGVPPAKLLQALLPQTAEYQALRAALAALSDNLAQRAQLRANLERWRWLPRVWPAERIEVRIAAYELAYYRADTAPETRRVIVGAPRTPTPSFTAAITSVTLNPFWDPPASIVANELLPRFRRDPAAAAREGFVGVDRSGAVFGAAEIDWRRRPFPYQLRQLPSARNALGQLRFDLPNPYAVYLHDTPAKSLFVRANRARSHGCVRVDDPVGLAVSVLASADYDATALEDLIAQEATVNVSLAAPLPIYILYLTTKLGADGTVTYLDDIYRRDASLSDALDAAPIAAANTDAATACAR